MIFDPSTLEWKCDVCKAVRPDANINVYKKTSSIRGVEMNMNIKYCNDKQGCIDKAPLINLFGMGDEDGNSGP